MNVVNAVGEVEDEGVAVEELVGEMARVKINTEAGAVADGVERLTGGDEIIGDLGRVNFQAELDPFLVEHVNDRVPAVGKILVAALDLGEVVRREGVEHVPDAGA